MNNIKEYKIVVPKGYHKIKLKDRDIWLEALRSGKYRQGEGMLAKLVNKRYNYCCLGIRLKSQNRLKTCSGIGYDKLDVNNYNTGSFVEDNSDFKILGRYGNLPDNVYVKIEGHHDEVQFDALSDLNDNGFTFKQIADIIERLYKNA